MIGNLNYRQLIQLVPLLLMLLLSIALATGLFTHQKNPADNDLIGHKFSSFSFPVVGNPAAQLSPDTWKGRVAVISIFASWCGPCQADHAVMMKLANTGKVPVYGIAWRDQDAKLAQWLRDNGNPYQMIGIDKTDSSAGVFSITGIPNTFVIGKDGTISYHSSSALTDDIVNNTILPLVEQLNKAVMPVSKINMPIKVPAKRLPAPIKQLAPR